MEKLNSKKFQKLDVVSVLTKKMESGSWSLRLDKFRQELIEKEEKKQRKLEKAKISAKKKALAKNLKKINNPEVEERVQHKVRNEEAVSKVKLFKPLGRKNARHNSDSEFAKLALQEQRQPKIKNMNSKTKGTFDEFKRQINQQPNTVRKMSDKSKGILNNL